MPETRIPAQQIAALKNWMETNKEQLLSQGIERIDGLYTDDDLSSGAFDEFHAFTCTGEGSPLAEVPFTVSGELHSLFEEIAATDHFFPGQEGGGGTIRLQIESGAITHVSFEYATVKDYHAIEAYQASALLPFSHHGCR